MLKTLHLLAGKPGKEIAMFRGVDKLPAMKLSALTYLVIGIVFGLIAVFFGVIKEYSTVTPGVLNQFVHADATIYACGLIAAACFVTSGIVLIHSRER